MTYDEITLFRRFLTDKGTLNNFEYFYANHRFKRISIDAYLEQTDPEDVILNAFDMGEARNTIFNFQYWKKLNEKWQRKLQEFRDTGKMDVPEQQVYCPHCKKAVRVKHQFVQDGDKLRKVRVCGNKDCGKTL